jgi:hypothetical protein
MDSSKCKFLVHPLAKGAIDHLCTKTHYRDGWCYQHHPQNVADREEEKKLHQLRMKEKRKNEIDLLEGKSLTIENAIVLLVQNGYRVEKVLNNTATREASSINVDHGPGVEISTRFVDG